MSGFLRGLSLVRSAAVSRGSTIIQRANVATRPAKEVIGPLETSVGLVMFSFAILGPAGWILANLESYKNKDSAEAD
ncbi:cytochrome c oxidase subunit 8A, mitochondrial [Chanos chanos]|uniref:Cytochrome c oxidase subunit 8A, mitochondrial n=1 Tax=Chanos chanos TaxID=29144 RepID=A0A6J2W429_CHACN|nr:cytochrome c oxidase subunit 8A, mitochondrial-like [Chanos chanos]